MKLKLIVLAISACAAAAAGAAVTDFTVNGTKVTAADQEQILQAMASRGQERTPELEAAVRQDIITRIALVQEAKKEGLEKDARVLAAIENAKNGILAEALISKHVNPSKVTDAELRQLYDQQKAAYGDTEYQVRHFTVATQADAQKALDRIKTGEAFEKVASEVSLDKRSKARGGDIGWHSPATILPPVAEKMRGMKKGEISQEPIALGNAFDVIQVVDTRPAQMFPAFEQAKPALMRSVLARKVGEYTRSVAEKANVK